MNGKKDFRNDKVKTLQESGEKIPSDLLHELKDNPSLSDELKEWLAISEYYDDLQKRTRDIPSDRMYSRIANEISSQSEVSILHGMKERLLSAFKTAWFPWALVFAQALVILFLIVPQHSTKYTTLSSSSHQEKSVTYLNVVFDDNAREAEIRNLLIKLGAEIVSGPEPNGLYVIRIPSSKFELETVKTIFKQTNIVKFWAPRY